MEQHNQPVYPTPFSDEYGSIFQGVNPNTGEMIFSSDPGGLTKLELFSKDIFVALISRDQAKHVHQIDADRLSSYSINMAATLLAAIEAYQSVTDKMNQ